MSHIYLIATSVGNNQENKRIFAQELKKKYENLVSVNSTTFLLKADDSLEIIGFFLDSIKEEGDQYFIFQVDDVPMASYANGFKHYKIGEVFYGKNFLMKAREEAA